MADIDALAHEFERHRPRLRAVAYRILGSSTGAEDVVQQAWIRFSDAGIEGVENVEGWLTTIVARLRSRRRRPGRWVPTKQTGWPKRAASGPRQRPDQAGALEGIAVSAVPLFLYRLIMSASRRTQKPHLEEAW